MRKIALKEHVNKLRKREGKQENKEKLKGEKGGKRK